MALSCTEKSQFLTARSWRARREDFSTSRQATQARAPAPRQPLLSRLWCRMLLADHHFTCRQQRQCEWVQGRRGPTSLGLGGLMPSRGPAAYLEQGDCGAVEETQEEEHDEGGSHGVEVLEAFLLGAHLPLCRRHGKGSARPSCPQSLPWPPSAALTRQECWGNAEASGQARRCVPAYLAPPGRLGAPGLARPHLGQVQQAPGHPIPQPAGAECG